MQNIKQEQYKQIIVENFMWSKVNNICLTKTKKIFQKKSIVKNPSFLFIKIFVRKNNIIYI
jgi:hypothetical protein